MKAYKKGQILIMVLALMTVVAVIVVSTVNTAIRNSQGSAEDARYNTLYTMAEDLSIQMGMLFGNPASNNRISVFREESFNEFLADTPFNVKIEGGNELCQNVNKGDLVCYQCEVEREPEATIEGVRDVLDPSNTINGIITVCDTPFIENAEVFKDEIIVFDTEAADGAQTLTGNYITTVNKGDENSNPIKPSNANVALEFTIDFSYVVCAAATCTPAETANVQSSTVKRVVNYVDTANVFSTVINTNADNNRYISLAHTETPEVNNYTVDMEDTVSNIEADTAGYVSHLYDTAASDLNITRINQFRIKPYMVTGTPYVVNERPAVPSIQMSIANSNPAIDITQGRSIEANIYETTPEGNIVGSQVLVISTVPAVKYPSFFDYVIKTDDIVATP